MDEALRTLGFIYFFVLIAAGIMSLTVMPFAVVITSVGPLAQRPVLTIPIIYLAAMAVLGFLVYVMVPAQYTKYLDFTSGVRSDSLWGDHVQSLQRAAMYPKRAPAIVQQVYRERVEFMQRWLVLTIGGMGIVVAALVGMRQKKARGPAGRSPKE